jgi:uncharacterized protein YjdB
MRKIYNTYRVNHGAATGFAAGSIQRSARRRALAVALSFLLTITLAGGLYPGGPDKEAYAAGEYGFKVTGGAESPTPGGGDYYYDSGEGILYINSSKAAIVEMANGKTSTSDRIYISTGAGIANITLNNVKIDVSGTPNASALNVASGGIGSQGLKLTLSGANELKSGENCAGIQLTNNANLSINTGAQAGSLNAVGGNNGAGIGAGNGADQIGGITINGGKITATSTSGAGIDGGSGQITLSGGEVVAERGGSVSNDISGNSVIINGGSVWSENGIAPDPKNAAGGTGAYVYANKLTLVDKSASGDTPVKGKKIDTGIIDGVPCTNTPSSASSAYGIHDVSTNDSGNVCFWLPSNTNVSGANKAGVVLIIAEKFYGSEYSRNAAPQTKTLSQQALSVAPSVVNFAEATIGYDNIGTINVIVTNDSEIDFKEITAESSSANFNITVGKSTASLGSKEKATISVHPNTGLSAGAHTATLTIKSRGVTVKTVSLNFTVKHAYKWAIDMTEIDFGVRSLNYTAGAFVVPRFTNTGTGEITDVKAELTGANEANFEVKREGSKKTFKPGDWGSISIRPMTNLPAGTYTANLVLTSKEAATVSVPVRFTVGSVEITGAKTGDKFIYKASGKSKTKQLSAVVSPPSGNQVIWTSSNQSIATVNSNGLVTFRGTEGKVKITATTYIAGSLESASVTIESIRNVTSFNTPMTKVYIQRGKTMTLPVKLTDSTAPNADFKSKLTWESSKPSVVSVSASGKITASKNVKKTTAATVTVTSANGKSKSIKVAVVPKAVKLKSVTATFPKNIKAGKSYQITVKLNPAKATGAKLTFKSSKPSVLKVNNAGKLFALKKGSAKITVKAGGKQYVKTIKVK